MQTRSATGAGRVAGDSMQQLKNIVNHTKYRRSYRSFIGVIKKRDSCTSIVCTMFEAHRICAKNLLQPP